MTRVESSTKFTKAEERSTFLWVCCCPASQNAQATTAQNHQENMETMKKKWFDRNVSRETPTPVKGLRGASAVGISNSWEGGLGAEVTIFAEHQQLLAWRAG